MLGHPNNPEQQHRKNQIPKIASRDSEDILARCAWWLLNQEEPVHPGDDRSDFDRFRQLCRDETMKFAHRHFPTPGEIDQWSELGQWPTNFSPKGEWFIWGNTRENEIRYYEEQRVIWANAWLKTGFAERLLSEEISESWPLANSGLRAKVRVYILQSLCPLFRQKHLEIEANNVVPFLRRLEKFVRPTEAEDEHWDLHWLELVPELVEAMGFKKCQYKDISDLDLMEIAIWTGDHGAKAVGYRLKKLGDHSHSYWTNAIPGGWQFGVERRIAEQLLGEQLAFLIDCDRPDDVVYRKKPNIKALWMKKKLELAQKYSEPERNQVEKRVIMNLIRLTRCIDPEDVFGEEKDTFKLIVDFEHPKPSFQDYEALVA